jgi:phage tail sheath protein FI
MSMLMPGSYVNETTNTTYTTTQSSGTSTAAFVGAHNRGPLTPLLVTSWSQFQTTYGGFSTYPPSLLALAVFNFFGNNGTQCIVQRVVSSTSPAVTATLSLNDTESTPEPTLQVQALNPGLWGNGISVAVTAGTVLISGVVQTFNLVVYYGGQTPANVVETWNNLTMLPASTYLGQGNYALSMINSQLTGSKYITVNDLGSVSTTVTRNPAVMAATSLATGADGGAPATADSTTAISLLDQFPNTALVVNLPGVSDATNVGNALSYCSNRGDAFLVIDTASGQTPTAAESATASLTQSSFGAVYYPWLNVSDPYSTQPGATRLVPPGGAVVGRILATDTSRGVAKAPAGPGAQISALSMERVFTNTDLGNLNNANVNVIYQVPNTGIAIMGARTLSPLISTRYVNTRRSLIYIRVNLIKLTSFAVFENNDYTLWTSINSILSQWLTSFWQSGGLVGNNSGQAFFITCDQTNNTPTSIQSGVVNITVGVALERPAEFVVISLGQWQGGATATDTSQLASS